MKRAFLVVIVLLCVGVVALGGWCATQTEIESISPRILFEELYRGGHPEDNRPYDLEPPRSVPEL
jgi:hypothetical protein